MQDEIRVTVIATGFEEAPANTASAPVQAKAEPARERPQGLYTAAAEKAEKKQAPAPAASGEEDPFDSIFKIFNTK